MFKGLFGGKKQEFFLELKEDKKTEASKVKIEAPVQVAEPQAVETVAETANGKAPKATKSKKTSVKKAAKIEAPQEQKVAVAPVVKKEEPKEVEFATNFLILPTSRRLPGPSLNAFKDLARQVKTRR
ncbi:hypothetical protein [Aphanothece sacrum]|uniref:Carbon monoxide dehydrogenase small chain n=1 Tax=Aphanothece sacrum FPU1 TaxID=1920663 RepID=A0A401IMS8_APHSA|nr:hypothetical protein [Aphanothece sacrum]GBF82551.1 carbon monoxide dehydrogenase small chain [Aphanothece sacrum FPU1]GBF84685.1 carbon monoxide dehydrogenase small chain [Aphanothece sacrum FPU3]